MLQPKRVGVETTGVSDLESSNFSQICEPYTMHVLNLCFDKHQPLE